MRRTLAAAFAALILGIGLVWTQPTAAWLVQAPAAGVAYTGPGDIVSGWTAFWSLRAFTSAKANAGASTVAVLDVLGATSGSCTIFLKGNGTGDIDLTTAGAGGIGNQCLLGATTFCTVTNTGCFIGTWYDQTANALNLVQSTANKPKVLFSCLGAFPCVNYWDPNNKLTVTYGGSTSQPVSYTYVAERTGDFTTRQDVLFSGHHLGFDSSTNTIFAAAGTLQNTTGSDSAWHAVQTIINSSSSTLQVDATRTGSVNMGTDPLGSAFTPCDNFVCTTLRTVETGLIQGTAISTTNQNAVCHNQFTYWGTSTSC